MSIRDDRIYWQENQMKLYLPSSAVCREIAKRQSIRFSGSEGDFNTGKMSAALAWPRMMITAGTQTDIFDVTVSLFTGILTEKPARQGNAALAFTLAVLTLRRNGWMLDLTNDDVLKLHAQLAKKPVEEVVIAKFFRQKSIPLSFEIDH